MKKLLFLLVSISFIFISCSKDEESKKANSVTIKSSVEGLVINGFKESTTFKYILSINGETTIERGRFDYLTIHCPNEDGCVYFVDGYRYDSYIKIYNNITQ